MKKIAKYLFAAVAMIAATSCAKELVDDFKPELQLQGKAYVFKGTLETPTKTVLDQNTMTSLWDVDETIAVIEPVVAENGVVTSVNKYVAKDLTAPAATAVFELAENGGIGIVGKSVFAVSPYSENHAFLTDATGLSVVYKTEQVAVANSYDPEGPVAVAYNADVEASQNFQFYNASALLQVVVEKSSAPVNTIAVYSLAGEPISGAMVLKQETVDGEKKGTIFGAATGSANKVSISGAEGAALEAGVAYYIAVAPAVLKEGIGIRLNNDENQTYTISKEIKLERSKIYDLGVFKYDAPAEEDWYIIGDFTDGNANSIKKTQLVQADNNFYVAENVEMKAGQPFKVYNPSLGASFYVENGAAVEDRQTAALVSGDGFGKVAADGVYDIYLGYTSDWDYSTPYPYTQIFSFVDVLLVSQNPKSYPAPKFSQLIWYDDEEGNRLLDFGDGIVTVAVPYGEEWIAERQFPGDYKVTPITETSGEITWVEYSEYSTYYYRIAYSNLTSTTVDIFSTTAYNSPVAEPVFDEQGEFLSGEHWSGVNFVDMEYVGYSAVYSPVECEIINNHIDIILPSPDKKQYKYYDNLGDAHILDLGYTEEGKIITAKAYGEEWMQESTLTKNGYELIQYDMYSGEIAWTDNGTEYVIFYNDLSGADEWGYSVMLTTENVNIPSGTYYTSLTEPVTFILPRPDNIQLAFDWASFAMIMLEREEPIPAIIDLGVTNSGLLGTAFDMYSYRGEDLAPALVGWYEAVSLVPGGDPRGNKYEIVPDDMHSGVIKLTQINPLGETQVVEIPYSGYVDNNTPFIIDGTFIMESEELKVTPVSGVKKIYISGVTHMPGTTPEGKQWTWIDENMGAERMMDFSVTKNGAIYLAQYYDGQWISSVRYTDYTITPTSETSGVITFKQEVSFWGSVMTSYIRMEYSELTETSVKIFSPSYWTDDKGNDLPVLDENGDPMLDADEWPITWSGLGICITDYSTWEETPVLMTASPKTLSFVYQGSQIM